MEKILIELRNEVIKMKTNDEKDRSMGIVRSSVVGGGSRVAIQGGGGKRLITPRNM